MKNIIDYIKEKKDISFADEPFNEVDGLVLSELVYTDFAPILDENSDAPVAAVNRFFWDIHTEEEIMAINSYTKMAPFLMREMVGSARFGGLRFKNYVADISMKDVKQFAAITMSLPDGTDFVAFRGTNGTIAGWMEDFKFSISTTDGHDEAADYLNRYHSGTDAPLRLGGHSKGGNLAVYAAIFCESGIKRRIERIYSYDGPGFRKDILDLDEYERAVPKVVSVIPKDCAVGIMNYNRYRNIIITDSDARGIYEHDAYQWHIDGFGFEELAERSEWSYFFQKSLENWLMRCGDEKREKILEICFTQIMNSSLAEEDSAPLNSEFMRRLISESPKLSHSDKAVLLSSLSDVIIAASSAKTDELKDKAAQEFREKSAETAEEFKVKSEEFRGEFREKSSEAAEEFKIKSEEFREEIKEEIREKSALVMEEIKEKSGAAAKKLAAKIKSAGDGTSEQ